MKLIFLHGPPAVGKLTVARELSALTGWRLFHNHLAVDLALALFDFGTPGFVAMREEIWWVGIQRAVAAKLPALIFTFNPENSVPQRFIDELFGPPRHGAVVVSVALTATESLIEERVQSPSRKEYRKLTDREEYRRLRDAGAFNSPLIPRTDLTIDSSATTPGAAALAIAQYVQKAGC